MDNHLPDGAQRAESRRPTHRLEVPGEQHDLHSRAARLREPAVGRPSDDVLFAGHAGTPSALADEQPGVHHDRDHASDITARWLLLCLFLMPDA